MREIVIVPSEKYAEPDRVLCCCAPTMNNCMESDSGRKERTVIACLSLGVPEARSERIGEALRKGGSTLMDTLGCWRRNWGCSDIPW